MSHELSFIYPSWPAPKNIHAVSTTRLGGFSLPPFSSFNLASHVGDDLEAVKKNRILLKETLTLPIEPLWLEQVHSTTMIEAHHPMSTTGDGAFTHQRNVVCVILTADCLPIFLCNRSGSEVAVIHGGWRGLANGIIQKALTYFHPPSTEIMAWLGPAISNAHYEVGQEVYDAFIQTYPELKSTQALTPSKNHSFHWQLSLSAIASFQLQQQGVSLIFQDDYCTYEKSDLFYSYRREKKTGRMANLIWMT